MKEIFKLVSIMLVIAVIYFFSHGIYKTLVKFRTEISKKLGVYSASREHAIQRYIFLKPNSYIAKLYNWINEQIIALGYKRLGVTPIGYLLFWMIVSGGIGFGLYFAGIVGLVTYVPVVGVIFVCILVITRVAVSGRLEKREADIMDAVDLVIPSITEGVKNSISRYQDSFDVDIREDFKRFLDDIQDRGMPFPDAMQALTDNLGLAFKDFAQKAIYYEAVGDPELAIAFDDIVETNRLRRELRDHNNIKFGELRMAFIASSAITMGYFVFQVTTDPFTKNFFFYTNKGKFLLMVIMLVIFGVMSFLATIKSRAI